MAKFGDPPAGRLFQRGGKPEVSVIRVIRHHQRKNRKE